MNTHNHVAPSPDTVSEPIHPEVLARLSLELSSLDTRIKEVTASDPAYARLTCGPEKGSLNESGPQFTQQLAARAGESGDRYVRHSTDYVTAVNSDAISAHYDASSQTWHIYRQQSGVRRDGYGWWMLEESHITRTAAGLQISGGRKLSNQASEPEVSQANVASQALIFTAYLNERLASQK